MRKIASVILCIAMLTLTCCFAGTAYAENDVQRPKGFIPWYSFGNLNTGASLSHTGDVGEDEKSVTINGVDSIYGDYGMEQKIGLLTCEVVEGGPGGKLLKYGAGPKMKTDNAKYADGIWWPINISEIGDPTYCDMKFSNVGYFCFYVDMTDWTAVSRIGQEKGSESTGVWLFLKIAHMGDDGTRYDATSTLKGGNCYELQQPDGSWKSVQSEVPETIDYSDVTIESTGEVIHAPKQNGYINLPTGFKGYIRFKLSDTYETTYFDATAPGWGIGNQKDFKMNGLTFNSGFWPKCVGIGDDKETPGCLLFGDFGFMPPDPEAKPVADESKAEESKEEESKAEESKAEESKEEPSKVEASKADESVVPAQNNTDDNNSHKGLWITLGVVLVVLIGGGVAAFFIVKKQKANASGSEAVMEEPDVSDAKDDSSEISDNTDNK